ncbi:MAG: OadG family protein [Clostridia bacterium]|nr:OadG family protein [Clostridia bacterium]MEE1277918.1 OadG family protein [Acutalibacteraceae bacterium]
MKEYALEFVCAMGIGTVFVGLICLIIICSVIGAFCRIGTKKKEVAPVAPAAPAVIENKQEILAAVSAAIAEELGTDVSAIRITSFKKL